MRSSYSDIPGGQIPGRLGRFRGGGGGIGRYRAGPAAAERDRLLRCDPADPGSVPDERQIPAGPAATGPDRLLRCDPADSGAVPARRQGDGSSG